MPSLRADVDAPIWAPIWVCTPEGARALPRPDVLALSRGTYSHQHEETSSLDCGSSKAGPPLVA